MIICTGNSYMNEIFVIALWNVSPCNSSQAHTYFGNLLASVWQFQAKIGPHRLLFVESKSDPNVSCRVRKSCGPIKRSSFENVIASLMDRRQANKNQIGTIFNVYSACVVCPTSIVERVVVCFLRIKMKRTVAQHRQIRSNENSLSWLFSFSDEEHLFLVDAHTR